MTKDGLGPVCVTGGSGYIASHIVHQLLEEGYRVHATVRDDSNLKAMGHLLSFQKKFPGQMKLFTADLLDQGSFREAMDGCHTLIHTASPFIFQGIKNAQKQLVEPALQGTRNVLNSANETSSIKHVVLTSSTVAVFGDAMDIEKTQGSFNEKMWNRSNSVNHNPFNYSKTVAEQEAWRIAGLQDNWTLTVINPGFTLGPSLSDRDDSTSVSFFKNLLSGKFRTGAFYFDWGVVDVRDAAKAHVLATKNTQASGRHICVEGTHTMLEICNMIEEQFPGEFPLPKKNMPKWQMYLLSGIIRFSWKFIRNNYGYQIEFDNSYAKKDLGIEFRPFRETVRDHVLSLRS